MENSSAEDVEVSITFTFRNGMGTKEDRSGGHWNEPFCLEKDGSCVRGVMLHHCLPVNPYTLAISAREKVLGERAKQGPWLNSRDWASGCGAGLVCGFLWSRLPTG